jgi:hypothetical protein
LAISIREETMERKAEILHLPAMLPISGYSPLLNEEVGFDRSRQFEAGHNRTCERIMSANARKKRVALQWPGPLADADAVLAAMFSISRCCRPAMRATASTAKP